MSKNKEEKEFELDEDPREVVEKLIEEKVEEGLEKKNRFDEARIQEIVESKRKEILEARRWEHKRIKQLEIFNKALNTLIKISLIILGSYVVANFRYVLSLFGF